MALRKGGSLLGLCYGMLERNRLTLKLHAIERAPVNNELSGKILDIALYAAALYASLNGTEEVWICDPVSPAHVRMYQSKDYQPQTDWRERVTHLTLRLK